MYFVNVWRNRVRKFLDNPEAIWPFLRKKFYYNFIADSYLKYYKDFHYLSYEETIDDIITNNKSIVRFGDELFDMILGIGLYYNDWRQKYDKKLARRLQEIISSRDPRLLICFNPELILKTKQEFIDMGIPEQHQFWTHSKIFLKNYYHKDVTYGSALCFTTRYNKHLDFQKLKNFFETKHIVIVTSSIDRFRGIHLGKTNDFVEAPKSDAWQSYEDVKDELLTLLATKRYEKKDTLVLISMASAAKVLVYDLMELGYTAWDTGQFFDLAFKEIQKLSS